MAHVRCDTIAQHRRTHVKMTILDGFDQKRGFQGFGAQVFGDFSVDLFMELCKGHN